MQVHENPLVTPAMLPAVCPQLRDPSSVFNPGAIPDGDEDLLLLRVQDRGRRTHLLPAWHDRHGGVRFADALMDAAWQRDLPFAAHHVYDARLTRIEGRLLATVAVDTDRECRTVLLDLQDLGSPRLLGVLGDGDERNCVLFPAKVEGRYLRLTRPNLQLAAEGNPATGETIVLEQGLDLLTWRPRGVVAAGRPRYWDERIGAGPPPLLTEEGWLLVYHGVATHFASASIYQAGVLLLDAADPSRLLARGAMNILEPRRLWECVGQVPNVVFPSGLCVDHASPGPCPLDAMFRLYYGAADTVVGWAEGRVGELVEACRTS